MDQNQYLRRRVVTRDKATLGPGPLARHLNTGFPDAEAVLLCCFDASLRTEQSRKRLRRALIDAGFTPGAANYFIRTSRLLDRVSSRRFRIRAFAAAAAAPA